MRIRARRIGPSTEVNVLISHPMETGLGLDADGGSREAHYITDVEVSHLERVVFAVQLSIAVSKDPLLSFKFSGGDPGDRILVTWVDNTGERGRGEATILSP
jgi:sulfur-oxidizing protein SoxZ